MVKLRDAHPLLADGTIDIEQWLTRIDEDRSNDEMFQIKKAAYLAKITGENVLLPLGESCLYQGLIVAEILHQLGLDATSLMAAVVYDSIRYAHLSLDEIEKHLGIAVRVLLQGIQKIDAFSTQTNKHIRQTENLRRMLFAIVEDVRVVLIKLASHTAEMRLTKNLNEATRKQKAEETQEIYAPLANRLGIGQLKWELEDLAFRYLDPNHYQQIAQFLHEKRLDREDYIEEVVSAVNNFLLKQDIQPQISGRANAT
jgi:GTP pyrophosphokinase